MVSYPPFQSRGLSSFFLSNNVTYFIFSFDTNIFTSDSKTFPVQTVSYLNARVKNWGVNAYKSAYTDLSLWNDGTQWNIGSYNLIDHVLMSLKNMDDLKDAKILAKSDRIEPFVSMCPNHTPKSRWRVHNGTGIRLRCIKSFNKYLKNIQSFVVYNIPLRGWHRLGRLESI
jgi:hypothetical protein